MAEGMYKEWQNEPTERVDSPGMQKALMILDMMGWSEAFPSYVKIGNPEEIDEYGYPKGHYGYAPYPDTANAEALLSSYLYGQRVDQDWLPQQDSDFYITQEDSPALQHELNFQYSKATNNPVSQLDYKVNPDTGKINLFQSDATGIAGDIYWEEGAKFSDYWDIGLTEDEKIYQKPAHAIRALADPYTTPPTLHGGVTNAEPVKQDSINAVLNYLNTKNARDYIYEEGFLATEEYAKDDPKFAELIGKPAILDLKEELAE